MNKILILSLWQAEAAQFLNDDYVISIGGAEIKGTNHVLNLDFDDIEHDVEIYHAMNEDDAKKIVDFVLEYIEKGNILAIHCHAGISRSAGIALGIINYFDGNKDAVYKGRFPNTNCALLTFKELASRNVDRDMEWRVLN